MRQSLSQWIRRFALTPDAEEGPYDQGSNIEMFSFSGRKGGGGSGNNPLAFYQTSRPRWRDRLAPNREQQTILILMAIVVVVVAILSEFRIGKMVLYPFALISTVFHEFGHALLAWLTGGRMGSIRISMDESGATRFSGGWLCAILPAGYIGSTFVGAALLFLAFDVRASRWTAAGVMAILGLTLYFAHGIFTVLSAVGLMAMIAGALFYREGAFTRHFIIVMGVCASLQSILSILNSTVFNTIEGSDAYVFAQRCSILVPAFVYGLLWFLISLSLQIAAVVGALVLFK